MPVRPSSFRLGQRALRAGFAAACLGTTLALAQFAQPPADPPTRPQPALLASSTPAAAWRAPILQVQGAEQPIRLTSLQIDVEVAGGAAETRVRMVFFNPNQRVLEGKLQFPLAPGQVVSGFALDVDGQLRSAVPVEKARAQQVFEDIARRRVDPGLLQTTIGNNYELRVYPLSPGRTRTVELRIVEPAGDRLQIPLAYAARVEQLAVSISVPAARSAPELVSIEALGLRFERAPGGGYRAGTARDHAVVPREPLLLRMPVGVDAAVTTEARDGEHYFTLELPVPQRTAARALPRDVQIVWDASGSAGTRRIDRELALLDAYFAAVRDTTVRLVRVADTASPALRFEVRGGDWRALRSALESTVNDGASNLGAVRHDGVSREVLWFTDGLANYGAPWRLAFPVPVYAISSASSNDPAALQALADTSGGHFIDLATATRDEAAAALLRRGSALAGIDALGARDVVVQSQSAAAGKLVVAGMLTAPSAELTLRIRDASGAVTTRVVPVNAGRNPSRLAALQWARLRLASLEGEARINKVQIREIGKRFGLATRETSLLVLEQVEDYVRHEIQPPPELRGAYERMAAAAVTRRGDSDAARLANVVRRFEARVAWWKRDFPTGEPPAGLLIGKAGAGTNSPGAAIRELRRRDTAELRELRVEELLSASRLMPGAPSPAAPLQERARAADVGVSSERARMEGGARDEAAPSITIALTPAAHSSAAIERLRTARAEDWTRIYLDERRANQANVGFFLDAAEFFLAKPDAANRAQGLRALSNLAELDLQNRQVLRLLAYRLQQAGASATALPILERVLELAPNEPQSHRDLGLALAEGGESQAAVQRLYEVVKGAWDPRFADIDLIALTELNAIVEKARSEGKPLDVRAIDPRLLRNLPLDIRVVLAWDADNTDVDLHVLDPNGEEVYYAHGISFQGGAITRDATGGYGPEEFALKVAKPGKYRVVANFYGHRQQVLTTGTGLMLWLSTGFGTQAQQDRRTTLRVKSQSGERVVVGEFEVGAKR